MVRALTCSKLYRIDADDGLRVCTSYLPVRNRFLKDGLSFDSTNADHPKLNQRPPDSDMLTPTSFLGFVRFPMLTPMPVPTPHAQCPFPNPSDDASRSAPSLMHPLSIIKVMQPAIKPSICPAAAVPVAQQHVQRRQCSSLQAWVGPRA